LAIAIALLGVACLAGAVSLTRSAVVRDGLAFAGYLVLAVAYSGVWSDIATRFRAGNDPVQDAWVLTTVTSNATTRPSRLFDGNVFFPAYDSVLYADPLLGPAALVLPLRAFTDNPALLYNVALLLGLSLAGYGFFRLGLHLTGDARAALLAGISVPYTAQQMHHMLLAHLPYLWIAGFPFLILGLLLLFEKPGPGPALLTGLAFALQAGTDGYYAFCSALLAVLVALWGFRRLRDPKLLLWAGAAAALGALLIMPYVRGFSGLKEEADMTRGLEWSLHYSTDLGTSLFRSDALAYRGVLDAPNPSKGGPLFPGLLVAGLAGVALARVRGPHTRLLLLIAAVFFLLSLGPELRCFGRSLFPLPFKLLYERVPPFNAMRHPTTLAVPGLMAVSLLAVLGLHALGWAKTDERVGRAAGDRRRRDTHGDAGADRPGLRASRALRLPEVAARGRAARAALRRQLRLRVVGDPARHADRERRARIRAALVRGALPPDRPRVGPPAAAPGHGGLALGWRS
jgi:hypothetical protein